MYVAQPIKAKSSVRNKNAGVGFGKQRVLVVDGGCDRCLLEYPALEQHARSYKSTFRFENHFPLVSGRFVSKRTLSLVSKVLLDGIELREGR